MRWSRLRPDASTLAVLVVASLFLAVAAASDAADQAHSLWRDPISYFGAASAPYPVVFNLALAALGVAVASWAIAHRSNQGGLAAVGVGLGAIVAALAAFPIDCSPVDDLCEAFIRNRVHSTRHRIHALAAATLFFVLTLLVIRVAIRSWFRTRAAMPRTLTMIAATVAVLLAARIAALPFDTGTAVVEASLIVLGVVATVTESRIGHPSHDE